MSTARYIYLVFISTGLVLKTIVLAREIVKHYKEHKKEQDEATEKDSDT